MSRACALVLDTETTGLTEESHIVELSMGWMDEILEGKPATVWRFKPPISIPKDASDVHGITDTDVELCPSIEVMLGAIKEVIEVAEVVVGYNPDFDLKVLKFAFRYHGIVEPRWPPTICGKRIWDQWEPRPPRDLTNAYKRFVDGAGFSGAHGAQADVHATARVIQAQLDAFSLNGKPWEQIDKASFMRWGPSDHIVWNEDRSKLLCNFGKNKGIEWYTMDMGMLRWVLKNDFPAHVKSAANKALNSNSAQEFYSWAREVSL